MARQSIAIVGFGDLGERLCQRLGEADWQAYGLRRNAAAVPPGVSGVAVDLVRPDSLTVLESLAPDALVVTLSPGQRSVEGYRAGFTGAMQAIVHGLGAHRPRQAFFVSSTRVYAEQSGGWVDEDSAVAGDDPHAAAILAAEALFLDASPSACVLRAAGLYGSEPGFLLRRVAGGELSPREPLRYTNRIHRDDVAGFIAFLLQAGPARLEGQRVVNLVDAAPVAMQEVEAWFCAQLGQRYEPPQAATGDVPGHKRIRSRVLPGSGYVLAYPDYRSGYAAALRQWLAHSES
jgi:nucleoside-diphosphate-sugar epimerase